MLTKLLKHEFRATARIMGPLYLVLLAVALGFNFSARLMDSGNFVLNMLAALLLLGRNRHHPRSGPVRHTAEEPLRQL